MELHNGAERCGGGGVALGISWSPSRWNSHVVLMGQQDLRMQGYFQSAEDGHRYVFYVQCARAECNSQVLEPHWEQVRPYDRSQHYARGVHSGS